MVSGRLRQAARVLRHVFQRSRLRDLFGREGQFHDIHGGPYRVLLDKKDILAGEVLPMHVAEPAQRSGLLRQELNRFWHELSHFIKAMGRRQLWFAQGQLEVMRRICVNLARLRYNFSDAAVGEEPYFKLEKALPVEQLSPLQVSYGPMEYESMLQAGLGICRFYREVAPNLATLHHLPYPTGLEQLLMGQLKELGT